MRPVDADAFVKEMKYHATTFWREVLDESPTLDVYQECEMMYTGLFNRFGVCSNCGGYIKRKDESNFCPHCGARIVKEKEWF